MIRKILIGSIIACCQLLVATAQNNFLWRDSSIAVFHGNQRLVNPWAGGMNTGVFATIDLNGDGRLDLIQLESPSFRINPFINTGQPGVQAYKYAPEYRTHFPSSLEGWIRTYDYDADGDMDLFTYYNAGIAAYRNDFNPVNGLQFTQVSNSILSTYGSGPPVNIFASRVNAPALSDVDNDGDMDILNFSISGSWVEYHENVAVDSFGTPSVFKYYYVPVCWGYFVLSNLSNKAILPPVLPTCPLLPADPFRMPDSGTDAELPGSGPYTLATGRKSLHAGSCLLVYDQGGDGDKDVLNGDILSSNLLFVENCGTKDSAFMCAQDTAFPAYDVPVTLKDVSGPHYFDVTNDGKNDLLVSNFFNTGEDFYNVWLYRNTSNNNTNVFSRVTDRWLVDGMIEVGTGAHPVFFDVDQDGKKDLLIGNDFYYNNNSPKAKIAYYRNTSTGAVAEYTLVTNDFASLSSYNLLGVYLTFGDLDGDGDADMLVGESDGGLIYFQNIAGAGNPCTFVLTQANYQSINVSDNAVPQLVDVDRDGKIDLLVGKRQGTISYYRNTGTATVPVFSFVTQTFGGVNVTKVNSFAGFSAPLLFDNGSGYELLVGSLSGYIYHYTNIDGNLSGNFTLTDSAYQDIFEPLVAVPSMGDVDGDGKFDLVVGNLAGGLVLYSQNYLFSSLATMVDNAYFEIYPNPVRTQLNIRMDASRKNRTVFRVFDVTGKQITAGQTTGNMLQLDVSAYPSGLYVVHVINGESVFRRKFIKE